MASVDKNEINAPGLDPIPPNSDPDLGILVETLLSLAEELRMKKNNDKQYEVVKNQVFDKVIPQISLKGEKARLYAVDACSHIKNNFIRNNLVIGLASANVVYDEKQGRMRRVESVFGPVMGFLAASPKVELQGTFLSRIHTFCGHIPLDKVLKVLDDMYTHFDIAGQQEMVAILRPKGFSRGLFSWKFNKKGYDKDVSCPRCGLVFHKFVKRKGNIRYFKCSRCKRTNEQGVAAFEKD